MSHVPQCHCPICDGPSNPIGYCDACDKEHDAKDCDVGHGEHGPYLLCKRERTVMDGYEDWKLEMGEED